MSDQSQGPGWWQASDERWYPPELHPDEAHRRQFLAPPPPPAPVLRPGALPQVPPLGPPPDAKAARAVAQAHKPWWRRNGWIGVWIMVGVFVAGGIASAVAGTGDDDTAVADAGTTTSTSAAPDQTTTTLEPTTAPPTTAAAPVTLQGSGETNTDPITLSGGAYSVAYDFGNDCFYGATLESPSDASFVDELATGEGPVSGTSNLYGIDPGPYYVSMITGPSPGCQWTITLTRK